MTEPRQLNDIDAYVATLSDERRAGLALAEVAWDLAAWLNRTREGGTHDDTDATELAELGWQAASHFGPDGLIARVGELQRYLHELGYGLELSLADIETGEFVGRLTPPAAATD